MKYSNVYILQSARIEVLPLAIFKRNSHTLCMRGPAMLNLAVTAFKFWHKNWLYTIELVGKSIHFNTYQESRPPLNLGGTPIQYQSTLLNFFN